MKIIYKILIVFPLTLFLFLQANQKENETFSLTVEVKNLRNSKGEIQFALYSREGSIPDEYYEKYHKILKGEIMKGASRVTFKDLFPGKYAVNILHDENKNGKIDKGFILPVEGIGFSNFQSINIANRPNFSKASFELKGNKSIVVKVIYM